MPYSVHVDIPEAGDQDVYIHGLGSFRNGTTSEVDDEQAMRCRAMNAIQHQEHTADGGLTVESELGPEIDQLEMRGVTITKVGDDTKDDAPPTDDKPPQGEESKPEETPAAPEGAVLTGQSVVIETAEPQGGNQ